jgi:PAS domain S-box-containing protein
MSDATIGLRTNGGARPRISFFRAMLSISPVLAGLVVAVPLAAVTMDIHLGPGLFDLQVFLAGGAAAVLLTRLLVQRDRQVALQLVVSEIVGENRSPEIASERILEALCLSQGWDAALRWEVNIDKNQLEFSSGWSAPGRPVQSLIRESVLMRLGLGEEMAGRAWREGKPIWIANLSSEGFGDHALTALNEGMVSGCAVPVRVGKSVLAVLEFYCHYCRRENRESMAAVETVASSLGQMLARSYEQSRAEKLYRQQEILLDTVADGIIGLDRNGKVRFANRAAAQMLGTESSKLTGRPVQELLNSVDATPNQCSGVECALCQAAKDVRDTAASGEDIIFRSDGSSLRIEYKLNCIVEGGCLSGSVLSFRDVSQRHALDRLKNEFISTVSHELRTPVTAIRGALGLISADISGQVDQKTGNLIRIARSNSERLVKLVNDILDLDRLGSGRERLIMRQVQLNDIVNMAIDNMTPVAQTAGVSLIHNPLSLEITGDPDRLLQVVINLISNAVKFSPKNSAVSIVTTPEAQGVTLSVVDPGRGIPADKLETIFDRFEQVDTSDSRQKGGTGLGLAICKAIVQQHSGRIWAERNPDGGSTFCVYLPLRQSDHVSADMIAGSASALNARVVTEVIA